LSTEFAGSVAVPDSVSGPLEYYVNNTVKSRGLIEVLSAAVFRISFFPRRQRFTNRGWIRAASLGPACRSRLGGHLLKRLTRRHFLISGVLQPQPLKPINVAMHNLHCCHATLALQNRMRRTYFRFVQNE
jgi:hypothetical protein